METKTARAKTTRSKILRSPALRSRRSLAIARLGLSGLALMGLFAPLLARGAPEDGTGTPTFTSEAVMVVGADVRTLGMGEATAANGTGPAAASSNPALLGLEDRASFQALPPTEWPMSDLALENYALAVPLWAIAGRRPVVGVSHRRFAVEGTVRTAFEPETPETFRVESWSTHVTAGIALSSKISAGGGVRISDLGNDENLYSFDVGILGHQPLLDRSDQTLEGRLGMVVRNIGKGPDRNLPLAGDDPLIFERVSTLGGATPEEFALAGGAIHRIDWLKSEATLELVKRIHQGAPPDWYQHYGAELDFFDLVAMRVGYVNDQQVDDVTYGFGVHVPVWNAVVVSVDYANRPDYYKDVDFINGEREDFWSFGLAYIYR